MWHFIWKISLDLWFIYLFSHTSTSQLLDKPWSQVSSLSPPRFLPPIFNAHRVQQSQCSPIFHRVLLTHALALSASQFVRKKKSTNLYKYALGGIRTHETDLYQARGKPNTPPGRPAVYTLNQVLPTSPLVVEAAG